MQAVDCIASPLRGQRCLPKAVRCLRCDHAKDRRSPRDPSPLAAASARVGRIGGNDCWLGHAAHPQPPQSVALAGLEQIRLRPFLGFCLRRLTNPLDCGQRSPELLQLRRPACDEPGR